MIILDLGSSLEGKVKSLLVYGLDKISIERLYGYFVLGLICIVLE